MFRKPKKPIQRRVFTACDDEDVGDVELMDIDDTSSNSFGSEKSLSNKNGDNRKDRKKDKKYKLHSSQSTQLPTKGNGNGNDDKSTKKSSLLSFADDDEESGEVFQVKKTSHSKKLMKQLEKERKKKLKSDDKMDVDGNLPTTSTSTSTNNDYHDNKNNVLLKNLNTDRKPSSIDNLNSNNPIKKYSNDKNSNNININKIKSDSIQTEIRTDDFVLVVKKSEPEVVLNGRAAFCAGRDDMSDEDEEKESDDNDPDSGTHRFSKPDNLKSYLERGSIPDAAMIHAARKRRQKAREQGDFISIEEPKVIVKKGSRLAHDDADDGSEEEERVDMNAITGIKEREERREQFYSVQNEYSDEDSEHELNEWENQQIRKGVTGAQLVSAAQHESLLQRFCLRIPINQIEDNQSQSTGTLLEQAYAKNQLEKPRQLLLKTQKNENKPSGPRAPQEITDCLRVRLDQLKELNSKHNKDIERICLDLQVVKLEAIQCTHTAPTAAAKYRFYQELRGYITDLIECLDEKMPSIIDLEKRALDIYSKHANFLIERRRQDVRDQAKEIADASKPSSTQHKKGPEQEEHIRRAAEREGRRTRRRCDREKNDLLATHLDGMSSDDEMHDQEITQFKTSLEQIEIDSMIIFEDTSDEFCKIEYILMKFEIWRKTDMESYKDAFVNLCLPKIVGPLIRLNLSTWSPFEYKSQDFEKMDWYAVVMQYASTLQETEEDLANDPDVKFVPTIIEKIILPKITEIIENCWDPLSTTQTLRLIGLIRRLGKDYPLCEDSKQLQALFNAILDKMKNALENDVFIPIFPKQMQEAKTSFFQRQFCSSLKLFRNLLSWQSILSDNTLKELAISLLLNRYLFSAMRVCTPNDSISKALIIVNTLPTAWLQPDSNTIKSLNLFVLFIKSILENFDKKNPMHIHSYEKAKQILQKLHSY